jgi:cobalt/nickel transport system permease protein
MDVPVLDIDMAAIDRHFFDIGYMDTLSSQQTPVHRLDPRAKLLTTLVFIVMVVSFGKYEISALIPFFIYPVVLCAIGNVPPAYLLKKLVLVSPFAILLGIFNPLLDRDIMIRLAGIQVSGGWVSFASILIRFVLTVGVALTLIAVTGFNAVCMALEKLGAPKVFVVQLLFLHRYMFVLVDEAARIFRARALRSFGGEGTGIKSYGSLAGQLLLRTLDRAQRIYLAMSCRGFEGQIRIMRPLRFGPREIGFIFGWSAIFFLMRFYNLPVLIGRAMTELMR